MHKMLALLFPMFIASQSAWGQQLPEKFQRRLDVLSPAIKLQLAIAVNQTCGNAAAKKYLTCQRAVRIFVLSGPLGMQAEEELRKRYILAHPPNLQPQPPQPQPPVIIYAPQQNIVPPPFVIQQPYQLPPPIHYEAPRQTNCTSEAVGNSVYTNCQQN